MVAKQVTLLVGGKIGGDDCVVFTLNHDDRIIGIGCICGLMWSILIVNKMRMKTEEKVCRLIAVGTLCGSCCRIMYGRFR